jgi:hypothetical protein
MGGVKSVEQQGLKCKSLSYFRRSGGADPEPGATHQETKETSKVSKKGAWGFSICLDRVSIQTLNLDTVKK